MPGKEGRAGRWLVPVLVFVETLAVLTWIRVGSVMKARTGVKGLGAITNAPAPPEPRRPRSGLF